jgi:hypothetical protein
MYIYDYIRVYNYQNPPETCIKRAPLATLKMEVIFFSEMSVVFQRNTQCHIPEDRTLKNLVCLFICGSFKAAFNSSDSSQDLRIVGGGVQTGSTRHRGHLLSYCACPG